MSNKSEPVAWMNPDDDDSFKFMEHSAKLAWIESCGNNCRVAKVYTVPLYTHPAPALTAELRAELIYTIESLIEMNYAPESNCSCHISPPCNDCVEYSRAREVNEHAKSAITKLTNLG
jgi:hypothetical protein